MEKKKNNTLAYWAGAMFLLYSVLYLILYITPNIELLLNRGIKSLLDLLPFLGSLFISVAAFIKQNKVLCIIGFLLYAVYYSYHFIISGELLLIMISLDWFYGTMAFCTALTYLTTIVFSICVIIMLVSKKSLPIIIYFLPIIALFTHIIYSNFALAYSGGRIGYISDEIVLISEKIGFMLLAIWFLNPALKKRPAAEDKDAYIGIGKHLIFSVVTFGVYVYVWIYKVTDYLSKKDTSVPPKNPTSQLLLCLFVPFYSVYWMYQSAQSIERLSAAKRIPCSIATMCLVLAIFFPIVPFIIIQSTLNDYITAPEVGDANTVMPNNMYTPNTPNNMYTSTAPTPQNQNTDTADMIKKYKELFDMGAITQEEYDLKKKELLDL